MLEQSIKTLLTDSESMLCNPHFIDSPFQKWVMSPNVTKGWMGEKVAKEALKDLGMTVTDRTSKQHDMIVDGKKVEVKTAFKQRTGNEYLFYGIKQTDDAHYWVLLVVEPNEISFVKLTRADFSKVNFRESKDGFLVNTTKDKLIKAGQLMSTVEIN